MARLVLKTAGNPLAFTAIHDFVAGLILLPLVFFNLTLPHRFSAWLFFLGLVVCAFLSDWVSFVALKKIPVSTYQMVNQVRHIFVLLIGWCLFSEPITSVKLIGLTFIALGVLVLLYEKSKLSWSPGIVLTMVSSLLAVIAFTLVKYAIKDFSEVSLAFWEFMAIGLLSFGVLRFDITKIKEELRINKWGLLISGACFGLFELFLFMALKLGDISKVIPVIQSSLVFGVVLGIVFLKERERLPQKIVGTILIVLGIVALYYVI